MIATFESSLSALSNGKNVPRVLVDDVSERGLEALIFASPRDLGSDSVSKLDAETTKFTSSPLIF